MSKMNKDKEEEKGKEWEKLKSYYALAAKQGKLKEVLQEQLKRSWGENWRELAGLEKEGDFWVISLSNAKGIYSWTYWQDCQAKNRWFFQLYQRQGSKVFRLPEF